MDAVGADQRVALGGERFAAVALFEARLHPVAVFGERHQPAAAAQLVGAEPLAHRIQQHGVQLAAMDGELRRVEAGVGAAQFAPHHLAEAVGIDQLARADAGAVERRQQAQRRQFLDRVRQGVDADAEFAQLADLLEHGAVDADGVQRQRRRQPADPAAHDQHMHRWCLLLPSQARPAAAPPTAHDPIRLHGTSGDCTGVA